MECFSELKWDVLCWFWPEGGLRPEFRSVFLSCGFVELWSHPNCALGLLWLMLFELLQQPRKEKTRERKKKANFSSIEGRRVPGRVGQENRQKKL